MWLSHWGAKVTGYALPPPTIPNLYELSRVAEVVTAISGDIRDSSHLAQALQSSAPEIVIHMAAQPLVRESYQDPVSTYEINVMGTVNLLEAVRNCKSVKAVINVTTDKCYENKEWIWGYRENEPLGGYDPYSSSKACSELVTAAYRNSFFNSRDYSRHGVGLATARAGNVIGGGDWAANRLIPDCINALLKNKKILIRNPKAIRPWQHVLEPLGGYILLAQKLCADGPQFAESWNFGPEDADARPVEWIARQICTQWGSGAAYEIDHEVTLHETPLHEAVYLKLDCAKARSILGWQPQWNLEKAIDKVIEWSLAYKNGGDLKQTCLDQIVEYCNSSTGGLA